MGHAYDPSKSTTSKDQKKESVSFFNAGPLKSDVYLDDLRLGVGNKSIHLTDFRFGAIKESKFVSGIKDSLEGILGMAYNAIGDDHKVDGLPNYIKEQK